MRTHKLASLALAVSAAFSTSLIAQETDTKQKKEPVLEQITVTAQKRTQSIQEVPISVATLSGEKFESLFSGGEDILALAVRVPGLYAESSNGRVAPRFYIRGLGNTDFDLAASQPVSIIMDEVVMENVVLKSFPLFDVQQVEVLRGPQGTLFGKNASAGVVNMTTKRPSDEFEGSAEVTLFQDNEYRLKTSVSGALNDNVNGSLTVLKSQFDGYIKNVYNNEMTNGYDKEGVRAMLDIEAGNDTDVLFIFENVKSDDSCCADLELSPSYRHPDSEALPNSTGTGDLDLEQRLIDHDFETRTLDETTGFSMQVDTMFGDHQFTSITAYRDWDNTEFREGDFTSTAGTRPFPVFGEPFQLHDVGAQNWKQTSQEFRIASPVGKAFDYQVGAFWWTQKSERNFTRDASCQDNAGQFSSAISTYLTDTFGIADPTEDQVNQYIADEGLSCNSNDIVSATAYMETQFDNWALFADGKYHINDDLRLLFGIRYTDDEVSYSHNRSSNDQYSRTGVGVRSFDTDYSGKTDQTNVSGKLGVQYDLTDNSMTYFTFSQGYKGPAFNVFYNMSDTDTLPIGEETSDAYELGYKYASRSVIFNAAIFRTDIDGFQANNSELLDSVTITRLTNAGSVTTQGFEFDFMWQATDNLSLTGGLSKVDAEVDKFLCLGVDCGGSSGADLPFSPDLKYSVTGEYIWEMDNMDIILNSSYVYTDEMFVGAPGAFAAENDPAVLPDYAIVNASLAFSFKDDDYRISIIGKNLTDESYVTTYSGDNFRYQIPRDADRYFGVQLRAKF
eukprot:TRINITY_DN122_c0_g1_i11.p2 TRINITY_DN122_c0_g1~~TRINITY_DN122_c0_g1_i11.p2  ORF type:complete len:788 (+),score=224.85 TRINITY_DN122_c0_g1_i11:18661-21024(+)